MSRIVYRITDEYAIVARKGTANLYLEWREGGQKARVMAAAYRRRNPLPVWDSPF